MENPEIDAALNALEASAMRLLPRDLSEREVTRVESAVAERERCVRRLAQLAEECPTSFTRSDLERVRASLFSGKTAIESLTEIRRTAWGNAIELNRNQYFLRTIFTSGDSE